MSDLSDDGGAGTPVVANSQESVPRDEASGAKKESLASLVGVTPGKTGNAKTVICTCHPSAEREEIQCYTTISSE